MKKVLLFIVLVLAGAAGAAMTSYWLGTHGVRTMMRSEAGNLIWLQHEFQLDDAQVQAIRRFNEDYAPICERNCARIEVAHSRLEQLVTESREVTPELARALDDVTRLRADCTAQTLAHVYQVASVMNLEQRQRYVAFMSRRITPAGDNGMVFARGH